MATMNGQTRHMVALLRPYAVRLTLCLLLFSLSTAIQLCFPLCLKIIVDKILAGSAGRVVALVAAGMLAAFVLRAGVNYLGQYAIGVVGERITCELRVRLFAHLQAQSMGFLKKQKTGDLISRLSSDIASLRSMIAELLRELCLGTLQLVGAAVITSMMNWHLALFVLLLGSLVTLTTALFSPAFLRLSRKSQDALASSMVIAHEALAGAEVVSTFNRSAYEIARFGRAIGQSLQVGIQWRRMQSLFSSTVTLINACSTILVLWYGAILVIDGRLSTGSLVAFLIYAQQIAQYIWFLGQRYSDWRQALGASQHVFELLDQKQAIQVTTGTIKAVSKPADIRFDNVSFVYGDGPPVLNAVSLDVRRGETVAIIGASGAGKSTILNLLARLYDVKEGRITINGYDVRAYTIDALRAAIAVVSQDVYLFGGSILENIRYGRLDATDVEIRAAATAANAHEFIEHMPRGYETEVGERGWQLSGGQRQRIAIARALVKGAPILLLDEAMSAIDPVSEAMVQASLRALKGNRTTLICAHRASMAQAADRVFRLVNGIVVERSPARCEDAELM
jgi:ATP-binding cassette, subfamily B, bacterial MsbA